MAKLSVITVTYHDKAGLADSLRSLSPLCSSDMNWEHILVDSSPEENNELISKLPKNWPLKHFVEPPQGVYPAMNTGAFHAEGNVLWFLNSGDRLRDLNALKQALKVFSEQSVDLVCTAADLYRDGAFLYTHWPLTPWVRGLVGSNHVCHQTVLYRASIWKKVGPFSTSLRLGGDYEHHLRCFSKGAQVRTLSDRLVEYDMSGRSSNYRAVFAEYKQIHRQLRPILPTWFNWGNEVLRPFAFARVHLLKTLKSSFLSEFLKPIWLFWKRRRC